MARQWLSIVEAEIHLARGSPDEALRCLRPLLSGHGGSAHRASVCAARAAVAMERPAEAEGLLAPVRERCGNPVVGVEAWLVTAAAAEAMRHDRRAASALGRALAIAEPQDIRRPFAALGPHRLEGMLRHARRLSPGDDPFLDTILDELSARDFSGLPHSPPVRERLTERECAVLSRLATLQTNDEIATELYISVNTVKSHARSVYRKLGVASRRQAVNRARDLGLI